MITEDAETEGDVGCSGGPARFPCVTPWLRLAESAATCVLGGPRGLGVASRLGFRIAADGVGLLLVPASLCKLARSTLRFLLQILSA